ncbi:YihY/virulence factor BrkB family protein [Comamonas kerstersii]|uniref:Ribonuclease BN n=1 Tax=Comamonas kerstersii TaxID=225992 RepID=A0A1V3THU0_9BURK|nr:YihY/virulence factor BrkB family protein [Comamonas kerstersii]AQZ99762.1 ribonuclease BN [Comamonas kerstersii]OOH84788.1 ribonuclease BN [Comamonas kerstersii]OOH90501.1 ribonuclease BN [Comamonas kerstersii]
MQAPSSVAPHPLLRPVWPLIQAVQLWLQADGLRMSAAMTFYGLLSLSPLLLLIVGLLGWWMDRSVVEDNLLAQVRSVMGERGASVVEAALASAQAPSQGKLASIAAFVLLVSGATGVFAELQQAFNKLWQIGQPATVQEQKKWWALATLRMRGLLYVLVLGFLLLVTMVLSTALRIFTQLAGDWLQMEPPGELIWLLNEGVSMCVIALLFMGLMRIGSGQKPSLRYLAVGAVVGALLFTLSKQALAWYLATAAVVSAYGAAGSLVVVLMWMYVTSAILLLSASCAKALEMQARPPAAEPDDSPKAESEAADSVAAARPQVPQSVGSRPIRQWPEV